MNPEESMRTKRSAAAPADAGTAVKIASVVAAIGGWAIGMYAGFNLLLPLVSTAVIWLAGKWLFGALRQEILPPFCVQGGHLVWFVFGMVMSRQYLSPSLIDVIWLAVGLTWLWLQPGKLALCFLAVYQLLSLPYNVLHFTQTDFGSVANKALAVHILWRCLALFYMARLYVRMSKPQTEA